MNLNNYSKIENRFIKKGFIIEKVERNESIYYINNSIKKNLIKLLKLNIPVKKLDLNNLHKYLNQKSLNKVRLNLIHEINSDKNFRKNYFFLAKNMLNKIIGNELVMQKTSIYQYNFQTTKVLFFQYILTRGQETHLLKVCYGYLW